MFHLLRAYFSGYRYLTFYTLVRVLEIGKFTAFLEVPLSWDFNGRSASDSTAKAQDRAEYRSNLQFIRPQWFPEF